MLCRTLRGVRSGATQTTPGRLAGLLPVGTATASVDNEDARGDHELGEDSMI